MLITNLVLVFDDVIYSKYSNRPNKIIKQIINQLKKNVLNIISKHNQNHNI